jgi:hypothetical protein
VPEPAATSCPCKGLSECRVYHTDARGGNVWRRLEADTAARKALPSRQHAYREGSTAHTSDALGWSRQIELADDARMLDAPLDKLHHTTLERYGRAHPVEFYAAIRPQCQTTSQTMRMLGTYASDVQLAQRLARKWADGGPGST